MSIYPLTLMTSSSKVLMTLIAIFLAFWKPYLGARDSSKTSVRSRFRPPIVRLANALESTLEIREMLLVYCFMLFMDTTLST